MTWLMAVGGTKFHPYFLVMAPQLAIFGALGADALLAGDISTRGVGRAAAAALVCVVWAQSLPLERSLAAIVGRASRLEFPQVEDLFAVLGFALLAGAITAAGGWIAAVLPPPRRRGATRLAFGLLMLLPGIMMALEPLVAAGSSWIELRRFLRSARLDRIVYAGEATKVDDYYLQAVCGGGQCSWRKMDRRDLAALGGEVAAAVSEGARLAIVMPADVRGEEEVGSQRTAASAPAGCQRVFANRQFVVFRGDGERSPP